MDSLYELDIDSHYHSMKSFPRESAEVAAMKQKLDEVLKVVRDIDQRLKNQTDPPPPLPRTPDDLKSPKSPFSIGQVKPKSKPGFLSMQTNKAVNHHNEPPPLPPKSVSMIDSQITPDGNLTLSSSQCLCLTLQLKAVRMFIDENFEDEYVDKEPNMACLDSAIRVLSGFKD